MSTPDSAKESSKGAMPPVIVKKAKHGDDDDGGDGAAKMAVKPGLLPTGLSRSIAIAGLLIFLGVLGAALSEHYANRYDLIAAPNSPNSSAYRIDRLSGEIQFCGPVGCSPVPIKTGDK